MWKGVPGSRKELQEAAAGPAHVLEGGPVAVGGCEGPGQCESRAPEGPGREQGWSSGAGAPGSEGPKPGGGLGPKVGCRSGSPGPGPPSRRGEGRARPWRRGDVGNGPRSRRGPRGKRRESAGCDLDGKTGVTREGRLGPSLAAIGGGGDRQPRECAAGYGRRLGPVSSRAVGARTGATRSSCRRSQGRSPAGPWKPREDPHEARRDRSRYRRDRRWDWSTWRPKNGPGPRCQWRGERPCCCRW